MASRSVILSLALISLSAVALNLYLERTKERHAAKLLAAQHEAAERQRRNDALMDAYGDRSNLGKLEQAVHFYEKKR